jgi:hypothetical protein
MPSKPYDVMNDSQLPSRSVTTRAADRNAMEPRHRSHRRSKKRNAGKLGLAGAVTGVAGVAVMAVAIAIMRPDGGGADAQAGGRNGAPAVEGRVKAPKTGALLSLRTPDGFGYSIGAARGGIGDRPLPGTSTPPPSGTTYAYIDYVLTNTQTRRALLDFPGDLFVQRSLVPENVRGRCMPQAGTPEDTCTLPNHSAVIGYLGDARAPIEDSGDQYMPPRASYLVRVATDLPVEQGLTQQEIGLYVWDARFTSDRRAIKAAFPE